MHDIETSAPTRPSDTPVHPETKGIELIPDSQRHGRARDLFSVWAAPNLSLLNFTIGATMILLGLELWQAILVIIAGSLPWVFPAFLSIAGPRAGTSASVISRAMYGVIGNKVVIAFTGWLVSSVFLALNWLASSFLGAEALRRIGFSDPIVVPITVTVVVSIATVLVAVYGHGLIIRSYPWVASVLLLIFLLVTFFVLPTVNWSYRPSEPLSGTGLWSAATVGFAILASTPLSYVNSPDFSRYLPIRTKRSHIIAATALGGALPMIVFTIVGALLATALTEDAFAAGIDVALMDALPMWLAPALVIGVILNTVALNAMTTYSSSMTLQAVGLPIRRIPAAVTVGAIGTALTIYLVLSSSLLEAINLMLQFLIIVSGPAMAIFVTDVAMRNARYRGVDLFDDRPGSKYWYLKGWNVAGIVAMVAGGVATAACLTTDVWTGPISERLGYIDLSVPIGMLTAALLYRMLSRRTTARKELA